MRRATKLLTSAGVLVATSALVIALSACGGSDQPPPTTPSATAYPPQPPPTGAYYPPPQQTGYPQTAPQQVPPPATGAAPAGTMATPGPLALPCQNDSACGLHRCNVQFQKCAFPCQTPVDCAPNNQCLMGVCAPKAPGQP